MSIKIENRNRTVRDGAINVACLHGLAGLTRGRVAAETGLSTGSVSNAFGSMEALRDAVLAHAVERAGQSDPDALRLVAQGLVIGNAVARNAPDDVKRAALDTLAA